MTAPNESTPEEFGPYLVLERLGMGGMATVHRARERGIAGFERIVALKRLLPNLAEDDGFVRAFVREAQLASLLSHANIVQLFELGRVGASYFISMEYIRGRDLRQILRQARRIGTLPPVPVVLALMIELLDALDYAHARTDDDGKPLGIVHRDVSPSNLLIGSDGHLKVIDFGIAKASIGRLDTHTGRIKGKLSYMAPEALTGQPVDLRSDLFAAAVIAHELMTARPLFAAKNDFQTMDRVQKLEVRPPSEVRGDCPVELDGIILAGLARDPAQRWATAGEMRRALEELAVNRGLLVTHREVAGWIEWAFAGDHLAPPPALSPRGRVTGVGLGSSSTGTGDSIDELMDVVWGSNSTGAVPLVLDEVPDVSDRHRQEPAPLFVRTEASEDEPTQAFEMMPPELGDLERAAPVALGAVRPSPALPAALVAASSSAAAPIAASMSAALPSRSATPLPRLAAAVEPGGELATTGRSSLGRTPLPMSPTVTFRPPSHGGNTPVPALRGRRAPSTPSEWAMGTSPPGHGGEPHDLASVLPLISAADASAATEPMTRVPMAEGTPAGRVVPSRGTATAMTIALPYTGPLERYRIPRRRLPLAIGIVGALAAGVVAAVVVDRGEDTPVAPPSRAEVRFLVEPSDATVLLDGAARSGELELAAGSYAVEVRRAGYRSWVSTLEVVGGENQTLRIPLLPGGSAMAHMIIASSPSGLAVTLDGAPLDQPTPVTLEVAAGQHTIALAQAGRPVWQRSFTAAADTQYEFHPVLEAAPEVARPARSPARRAARGAEATVVLEDFRWTRPPEAPAGPAAASSDPLTRPELVPLPVKVDDPPAAPRRDAGQAVVRPEAVKRLSGSLPTLSARHADDVPRRITAKLCIDERGRVESATVLGKVPSAARRKLVDAMERWRYAPYQSGGVATPVCFAPSFRLAAD